MGDIVLNINSSEYETLEDIINDAEFIYDKFDEFTIDTKIEDIPIEVIKDNLHLGRDKFYKNMALFLSKFPCEIFKELSEGRKIIDIQNKIKSRIVIN